MEFNPNMVRSMAEPIVLKLVSEKAMYGYEIIKVVNDRTNGAFQWKEGTLYPCLHRLEANKLIKSEWLEGDNGRKRKYYGITKKGANTLKDKSKEWQSFSAAVTSIFMIGVSA